MKRSYLFLVCFCSSLLLLTSCGKNPHLVDQLASEVGGNDTLEPDPTPIPTPTPTPTPPPSAKFVELGARDYDPSSGEKVVVELPYRTKKVKTIQYGISQSNIMCRLFGKDNCVRNRQVLFAFDIPALGKITKLHDIRIQANFIVYGKSYDTELLCLNNIGTCSGNGIKKIPLLGLQKYVKKKWWNPTYWAAGYEDVVKNKYFHNQLKKSSVVNRNTRTTGPQDLSLKDLFDLNESDLLGLLSDQESFWFTLTDDTFVQSPKLVIIYE
tara:strand:- start:356 stop:1159 length:804 start_codon:yes stop_codon:yes gene_type:complete